MTKSARCRWILATGVKSRARLHVTQEANPNALQEAYKNLPNDARASLRYHVQRDNGVNHPLQGTKDNKGIITIADVERVLAAVTAEYQGLSPDQIQNIRRMLESAIGSSRDALAGMQQQAEQAAKAYTDSRAQTVALSPQQEAQKLWAEFTTCEKKMQDEFAELAKHHKITPEQEEYLRTERARLDALPMDNEARIEGETTFAIYQKELGISVRDHARKSGDHEAEHSAARLVYQAGEQEKRLEELHKLNRIEQKEKEQYGITNAKTGIHMSDDGEPASAVNISSGKQGLQVANASINEIEAPSGGKDRSSGRMVVKT